VSPVQIPLLRAFPEPTVLRRLPCLPDRGRLISDILHFMRGFFPVRFCSCSDQGHSSKNPGAYLKCSPPAYLSRLTSRFNERSLGCWFSFCDSRFFPPAFLLPRQFPETHPPLCLGRPHLFFPSFCCPGWDPVVFPFFCRFCLSLYR